MKSIDNSGRLVTLKPGTYPIIKGTNDTRHMYDLKEERNALLLEFQGARSKDMGCWYALIDGDVIVAWEDQIAEGPLGSG